MIQRKVQSKAATLVEPKLQTTGPGIDPTIDPNGVGPWSNKQPSLRGHWRRLSLVAQFLIVAAVIVGGSMAVLGSWLNSRIEAGLIWSRAESAALYMEGLFAPHVQELRDSTHLPQMREDELDRLLINSFLSDRVEGVRIWLRDGTAVYSTDKSLAGRKLPSTDIDLAFSGQIVSQLEEGPDAEESSTILGHYPLLEVYAPIYGTGTRDVIAVGEFYQEAAGFHDEVGASQRTTWQIVGGTTTAIMGLLFLFVQQANGIIATQREVLRRQLLSARALADQNERLREAADKSRIEASKSNESFLNRIGADLHDGPIQLLSLLILKLGAGGHPQRGTLPKLPSGQPENEHSPERVAVRVMTELREISAGLVLPEIEGVSLEVALHLAVERHRHATGTEVDETYENLPEDVEHSLKICLYRIVQEGLNNAYRHAAAKSQSVSANLFEGWLLIAVRDGGPGLTNDLASTEMNKGLGLRGLRSRVETFGGVLEIRSRRGHGTDLIVKVPLGANPN